MPEKEKELKSVEFPLNEDGSVDWDNRVTTPQNKEAWDVATEAESLHGRIGLVWGEPNEVRNEIEKCLEALLASQKASLIEEIEKMRKEVKIVSSGTGKIDGHADFEALRYNKVLDDILTLLSTGKGDKQ